MTRPYKRGDRCSKCEQPHLPNHRYCRDHKRAADRRRSARLKAAMAICARANIVIPVAASETGFVSVPSERLDDKPR